MKEEFKKYLAMILAVFCTAALSILFFFILFRMDALQSLIGKILNILMPFIYGAGIAYVLKPLCNTYERFLNKHWHPKRQKLIGTVSVIGSIVTGLVVIYAVLAMLLPQLALSVARIARSLPEMIESISHMVDHLFEGNEVIQNYIMQLSDAGTESLSGWLKESILPYMNMILTGLSDSIFCMDAENSKNRANCCCTVCLRSVGRIRLLKRYVLRTESFRDLLVVSCWIQLLSAVFVILE